VKFQDILGQEFKKGDQVLFPVGFGSTVPAVVTATASGLEPNQPQPSITLTLVVTLPVPQNGVVVNVTKIPQQEPEQSIIQ
jgi:hypothetical protein